MYEIDFGRAGGGIFSYSSKAELQNRLQAEVDGWSQFLRQYDITGTAEGDRASPRLLQAWSNAMSQSVDQSDQAYYDHANSVLSKHGRRGSLFSVNSAEGRAVQLVAAQLGPAAMIGPLKLVDEPLGNLSYQQVHGVALYVATLIGIAPDSVATRANEFEGLLNDLRGRTAGHRAQIATETEEIQKEYTTAKSAITADQSAYAAAHEDLNREIAKNRGTWMGEWETLKKSYDEQLTIQGPVSYWSMRAKQHRAARRTSVCRAWGLGAGGIVIVAFAVWGGFEFASSLFQHLASPNGKASPIDVVPSYFHAELILGGAISLVALSLYLWVVRLAVRLYISEHHLAVDAEARASMAQTYLALTKRDRADEKDRAIVLATLFRPVLDGIVKDDAMPALTPSAIMAQWASKNTP